MWRSVAFFFRASNFVAATAATLRRPKPTSGKVEGFVGTTLASPMIVTRVDGVWQQPPLLKRSGLVCARCLAAPRGRELWW